MILNKPLDKQYSSIYSGKNGGKVLVHQLANVSAEDYNDIIPVRGPRSHVLDRWKYTNSAEGALDRFSGIEVIFLDGEEIYRCWYHGGLIS